MICIHLCRGNNRSEWYAEGGYDPIAEKLFNQLNVDAFSLEYESERAGTFEPLRFVPRDKVVILGLISSKLPQLESRKSSCAASRRRASTFRWTTWRWSRSAALPPSMEGNLLTEDEQWAKLKLVVDTAKKVWKDA